jgi:hypothetical protein
VQASDKEGGEGLLVLYRGNVYLKYALFERSVLLASPGDAERLVGFVCIRVCTEHGQIYT